MPGEATEPLKEARRLALACNRQLDVANSYLKAAQERTSTSQDLSVRLQEVETKLETCRWQIENTHDQLDENARGAVAGDMHEALLRWYHIQIQCKFAQVSVFSHDGFLGEQTDIIEWKARAEAASEYIHRAIGQIRSQDPRTIQSPHGSVADPTVDGTFYLQYRALFYLLCGREKRMLSEAEKPDFRAAGYRDAIILAEVRKPIKATISRRAFGVCRQTITLVEQGCRLGPSAGRIP